MGLPFFEYVVERQSEYRNKGYVVVNSIQTNGYLVDEEWAKFLKTNNFLVGVSLDGPAELHNFYRKDWKGRGTYRKVIRAIDILSEHQVEFNILTVVNRRNAGSAKEVYDFLYDHGYGYLQFIPCVERNSNGRVKDFSITPHQYGDFLCNLFDVWMERGFPDIYIRFFENLLQRYAGIRPTDCIFQEKCGKYFVLEHNGDIYPCDFFVTPEWRLGNIVEADIKEIIASRRSEEFRRLKLKGDQTCRGCRWYSTCFRGCPRYWFDEQGKNRGYSYFCESFKKFYEYSYSRCKKIVDEFLQRSSRSSPAGQNPLDSQ